MTEHNPEDLGARFRLDQAQAAEQEAERDEVRWAQAVRDGETTLDQREALTRRVNAYTSLLTTLDALVWIAVATAAVYGIVRLIGTFL